MHDVEVTEELVVPLHAEENGKMKMVEKVTFEPVLKVFHTGPTIESGHYTVDVLAEDGWYNVDDNFISKLEAVLEGAEASHTQSTRGRFSAKRKADTDEQVMMVVYKRKV